ncbi:DUF3515 domain-containing protein [Streptomyces sp. NPDC059788]|uniref:DUF3515 domain-containing protein n=1 Tax=Streptomyces sp. NPDC059788 TaxID=3346948 RepID=UPI00364BA82F
MASPSRKALITAGTAVGALATLGVIILAAATSRTPDIGSAPHAGHPACTDIAKRYPSRLMGKNREDTGAPGVAVWGDSTVVLRCGMTPPRPTTAPCFTISGVDWVLTDGTAEDGSKTLITYGRDPAVEVTVAGGLPSAGDSLVDLGNAVREIPQKSECVS